MFGSFAQRPQEYERKRQSRHSRIRLRDHRFILKEAIELKDQKQHIDEASYKQQRKSIDKNLIDF